MPAETSLFASSFSLHEQALAEAVAAVGAADLVAQQQRRVGVLVLDAAGDGVRVLVAGVERAVVVQLLAARDDQLADRVVGSDQSIRLR